MKKVKHMKKVFYPGCRIKARYPSSSQKLKDYLYQRYQLQPVDCCKKDYPLLHKDDIAVLICNNCAKELESLINDPHVEFIYELIDQDESFPFPDYHHQKMILQDCEHGYKDHHMKQTVRSLLDKMNIDYISFDQIIKDNTGYSKNYDDINQDIITYCAMCNLAFLQHQYNAHYLLDLLFNETK